MAKDARHVIAGDRTTVRTRELKVREIQVLRTMGEGADSVLLIVPLWAGGV